MLERISELNIIKLYEDSILKNKLFYFLAVLLHSAIMLEIFVFFVLFFVICLVSYCIFYFIYFNFDFNKCFKHLSAIVQIQEWLHNYYYYFFSVLFEYIYFLSKQSFIGWKT